jgi:hypothetical protein
MALAFGGGVRPELGRTDYTPFLQGSVAGAQMQAKGAEHIGAALANLGQTAAQAIGQYQERKQEKELFNNFSERLGKILEENPAFGQQIGITDPSDKGAIKAAVKALGGGKIPEGVQAAEMLVQGAMGQQQQQAQLSKMAIATAQEFFPGNEQAARMASINPDGFLKAAAEQMKPANVAAGATRITPFQGEVSIPTTGIQDLTARARAAGLQPGTEEYRRFMATGGAAEPRDAAAEQRIDRMMERGLSRLDAIAVVDGLKKVITDPVTGMINIVDMQSGTATRVDNISGQTQSLAALPPPADGESLYEMGQRVTGIGPSVLAAVQRVVGLGAQVAGADGTIPGAEEVIRGRQYIEASMQELVRSLSINPRFPVAEMERIRKEVDISPKTFTDPKTLSAKMRGLDKSLRARLSAEERAANNRSLPAPDQANALKAADDIRRFLNILGADRIPEIKEPEDSDGWQILSIK